MYDAIATLLTNISLFQAGILFGIVALIFGVMRGMTTDAKLWPLIFATFAWTTALIIPDAAWSTAVFVAGGIAVTITFLEPIKNMNESNIFYLGIVAILMNLVMLFGFGVYATSLNWGDNLEVIQTDIQTVLGQNVNSFSADTPGHGLCTPSQERAGTCTGSATAGKFNPLIFDVFASILAIGTYIAKAIIFAGMAVLAPIVIGLYLQGKIISPVASLLIGIYITVWQLFILYNIIKFILNKRGMA